MDKAAEDKLIKEAQDAASLGFITHLKTAGVSDDRIAELHESYLDQRTKRAARFETMRQEILAGVAETEKAGEKK